MAVIGDAFIAVHAITTGFEQDIEDAINRLRPKFQDLGNDFGSRFGDSFSRAFGRKKPFQNLFQEAERARLEFNRLTKAGYYLTPVIFGTASAISDLVFGLGALISALGTAAPALSVVANGFSALAQAGITAKLAFGGIGKAVQAMNKAGQGANNQKAIEDARRRLALAYQRDADAMAKANDRVRWAQIELNRAYKQGAEALQQLGFDAEEAALSQKKAAVELERAREALMRSQDLPVNDRGRRETEIAFKEAELNYRRITDRVNDLNKQQEYAAQTGVEGTQEVVTATKNLREAEQQRVIQARNSAQDIAQAQRAVAQAMAKSTSGVNQAMKDLSPEARKFARYLFSLKPVLKELRAAAGEKLFGPLQKALQILVDKFVPVLIPILQKTGKALGEFAVAFAKMLTNPQVLKIFERVFGEKNIKLIDTFGKIFTNLTIAFLKLLDAAAPLAQEFANFLLKLSGSAANADNFGEKITKAGRAAKIIGKSLGSVYRGLRDFFSLGSEAGLSIFKAFGKAGEALQKFSKDNAEEIKGKFAQIAKNVIAMGRVIASILKLMFALAGNKGVEIFANKMAKIPEIFADIGQTITEETAVAFGDFLIALAEVSKIFIESGSIKIFFNILTGALKIVTKIFQDENLQKIFLFLAAAKGLSLAIGRIGYYAKFFFNALLVGHLAQFAKGIMAIFTGLSRFRTAYVPILASFISSLTGITAPALPLVLGFIAALAALVFILVMAYKKSEIFRQSIAHLIKVVGTAFTRAWKDIQDAIQEVMPYFEEAGDIFKAIGDWIGRYLVPIFETILYGAIRTVGGVIAGLIRVGGGLFKIFRAIYNIVEMLAKALTGDFSGAMEKGAEAFNNFKEGMASIAKGVLSPISWIWETNDDQTKKKKNAQPSWMKGIDTPGQLGSGGKKIIKQAQQNYVDIIGGKTQTSKTGFAGSYNAFLNPAPTGDAYTGTSGLTSGPAAPNNVIVNINPSPGMDETEIGQIAAREVAWNLRRGN